MFRYISDLFQIYFYNPHMVKKAAELLQNGAVMDKLLQPHESHINYVLQFMMDYNLQGMNTVSLTEVCVMLMVSFSPGGYSPPVHDGLQPPGDEHSEPH